MADLDLNLERHIAASPQRVFEAWTRPQLLMQWWGPPGVTCPGALIDLRVGGPYAIANLTPKGTVWIRGEFEVIEPPTPDDPPHLSPPLLTRPLVPLGRSFAALRTPSGAARQVAKDPEA